MNTVAAGDLDSSSNALQELIELGKPAVPQLVEAVGDDAWGITRVSFLTALRAIKPPAETVLPALIHTCESPDSFLRLGAVMGLDALGSEARPALPALLRLAEDPNAMVREHARDAVCLVDKPLDPENLTPAQQERVAALVEELLSGDASRSSKATSRLARTGRGVVPALLEQLDSRRGILERFEILSAIRGLGPEADAAVPRMIQLLASSLDRHGAIGVLAAIGPRASAAVPALAALLETDEASIWGDDVAAALGQIGNGASAHLPKVLALCDLGADHERSAFVSALERIVAGDPSSLLTLCEALDSPRANVRCIAARALAALGELAGPCRAKLLQAARIGSPDSRYAAVLAVSRCGLPSEGQVQDLIALLSDREVAVRKTTVEILLAMGTMARTAVPALVERATIDESPRVRRLAVEAVRKLRPEPPLPPQPAAPVADWSTVIAELKAQESSSIQGGSGTELLENDSPSKLAALGEAGFRYVGAGLTHPDQWKRWRFTQALASMDVGPEKTLPVLVWALADDFEYVRSAAAKAVAEIGSGPTSAAARADIALALRPLLSDENSQVRWAAVEAIQRLGVRDSSWIPVLVDRLTDGEGFVRTTSMEILGAHGSMAVSAVPAVIAVLDDYVRTARPGYAKMPDAEAAAVCLEGIGPAAVASIPALKRALEMTRVKETRSALSKAIEAIEGE